MPIDLTTTLISHWPLDETSDGSGAVTREDAHGSNDLTDVNTIPSDTGKISNGALFASANSEVLTCTSNDELRMGAAGANHHQSFSIAFWIKFNSVSGTQSIVAKWGASGSREYMVRLGSSRLTFFVSHTNGTSFVSEVADAAGNLSTGVWYFCVAWHDADADTINIQINDGTVDSSSHSSGVWASNGQFRVGAEAVGNFCNAVIDMPTLWKRVLTSDERTYLYNSGDGRPYEEFVEEEEEAELAGVFLGGFEL